MEDHKIKRYYIEHFPRLYKDVDYFSGCDINNIREVVLEPIENINFFGWREIEKKYWRGFGLIVDEFTREEKLYGRLSYAKRAKDKLKKEKINAKLWGVLEIKALNVVRKKEDIGVLVLS